VTPERQPGSKALPLDPGRMRSLATWFYLVLTLAGFGWIWLRTGSPMPDSLLGGEPLPSAAMGLACAAAVVAASVLLLRAFPPMRWLAEEFRRWLGPLDRRTAAHLAIVSGVGEEIFFRGAMQPALGFVLTSVVFGLVHCGPDRRYFAWTAFAVVMGFLLGGILEATGSLLGPMIAHAGINYLNLRRIGKLDPPAEAAAEAAAE